MANDLVVQSASIELIAKVKADKKSASKAGTELSKAVKVGYDSAEQSGMKETLKDTIKSIDLERAALKGLSAGWGTLKTVLKGSFYPFKQLGGHIKDSARSLGIFFNQIKRIALYRLIRSALKNITQGFQEGIKNAYQWSVVTGNQFARSMDMMATSALYLKNSLGAMTMPLVNYLAPILDHITDQFVELINVVNRFIATITGASSWVKALKYPAEYMEQAAGSAKELKNQLLGFDDLNILKSPSGGGGASAMDYSNMFQQVELEARQINFTKSIMDAITSSDWDEVAKLIDEYINTAIENIPAKDIARALGEKLNKSIRLVHTLLKAVDFQMIGQKIGEFISNIQLDWGAIAGSWIRWNTNMLDALLGLVRGVNWSNVGRSIGEFVKGTFNEFTTWLSEIDWYQKGQEFTQAFIDLWGKIDWAGVATALKRFLKAALESALSWLIGALGKIEFDKYGQLVVQPPTYSDYQEEAQSQGYTIPPGMPPAQAAYLHSIGKLANGGFPEQGTMFIAGEAGAEFVGQIGGRTGVYNADQMTVALANANEGVVNTLTAVGNAIVGAINRKDMSINTNDVRRAINGMNMRYGV